MGKLIVAGMAIALALSGFKNLPRLDDPSSAAAGVALGLCIVIAYVVGKKTSAASAMAVAMAKAEAVSKSRSSSESSAVAGVQVLINNDPLRGARHVAVQEHPTPEWLGPVKEKFLIEEDIDADTVLEDVLGDAYEVQEDHAL